MAALAGGFMLGVGVMAMVAAPVPPQPPQVKPVEPVAAPAASMAPIPAALSPAPPEAPPALAMAPPLPMRPEPPPERLPRIAIVLDDIGINRAVTDRVVALRSPLTLAILPYAGDAAAAAERARRAGHETFVHMPMEPLGSSDPGPEALLVDLGVDELRRRFAANLAQVPGAVGVNNHMGSRFTADSIGMAVVMAEIADRGLLFLDSRTTHATVSAELAETFDVAHLGRDLFLDNEQDEDKIRAQLAALERLARRVGSAIAIGHPYPETLRVLEEWLPSAAERGFELVPVSALAR